MVRRCGAPNHFLRVGLLFEELGEVVEGFGVAGLAEPEDSLLADGGVFAGGGELDELGCGFRLREARDGEDGGLAELRIGIIFGLGAEVFGDELAAFLGHPELGLLADLRGGILMGGADELGQGFRIFGEREVEGEFFAECRVGVVAEETLDDDEAVVSKHVGEPEGCLFAEAEVVGGSGEGGEGRGDGWGVVESDGDNSLVAEMPVGRLLGQGCEGGDTVFGSDAGEPDEGKVAGVELAVGEVEAEFFDCAVCDAEEDEGVVEGDARLIGAAFTGVVLIALQVSDAAGSPAGGGLFGDGYGVAGPEGTSLFLEGFELRGEAVSDGYGGEACVQDFGLILILSWG